MARCLRDLCKCRSIYLCVKDICVCTDKSRLKDKRGNGLKDGFARSDDVRGCAETHSGANGKRLVPAIPAFRVLPAPAGPVQTVSDVSGDLMYRCVVVG